MKKLIILAALLVLLIGIGYGVYRMSLNMASDKLMENVSTELEKSGEMVKIKKSIENDPNLKKSIENDPELKKLIKKTNAEMSSAQAIAQGTQTSDQNKDDTANSNSSNSSQTRPTQIKKLPFDTKEGAAKLLISKIGLSELKDMYSKVIAGTMTKAQVLQILRSKLTSDEIIALKLVAYKEMNKS